MISIAFKKIPNGDYYYFGKSGTTEILIITGTNGTGKLPFQAPLVPRELIGKKVRIKLEIIENDILPK